MDEELVLMETIETIEEPQEEAVVDQEGVSVETLETDIGVAEFDSEIDNDSPMDETTLDVLDVEDVEEIEIEVDDVMGWSGDGSTHEGLPDRNASNQHIISSITGLEEILDEIKALKTVYSDGINVANYYKWEGDKAYDTYGYFVSLGSDPSEIKICDGSGILGVSVDAAGFIGGQDAAVKRDNHYGLIVNSGLVDVRCELDIDIGDCVVSNAYGYAKKADSDYGYRVLARANKDGVEYAVIALGAQADMVNELGIDLNETKKLVDANYTNIISAVNLSNKAYSKVNEIETSNQAMSGVVNEAVGKVDDMAADVKDLTTQVSNSALSAAQAKAIAESAATSAESMKNEAVEKANEALAETSELRKEFDAKVAEIDADLENTALELQATKESIESTRDELQSNINDVSAELENTNTNLNTTRDELSTDIDNAKTELNTTREQLQSSIDSTSSELSKTKEELSETTSSFEKLKEDLTPLTAWPDAKNPTGVAGFVARADEDSATLSTIVTWQGDTNASMAAFKQEVKNTYATIDSVTQLETDTSNAIASVKQIADDNKVSIDLIASWQSDTNESLAKVSQKADDNEASIDGLVSWKDSTSESISSIEQKTNKNEASINSLTEWQDEAKTAITNVEQKASDNEAAITNLTSWQGTTNESIAKVEQKANDNESSIEALAQWQGEATQSIAKVEEKANANEGSITLLTEWKSDVEDDVESIASIKTQSDANKSSIESLTGWQGTTNESLASIKQQSDANKASIEAIAVWQGETEESISVVKQQADDNEASIKTLTEWKDDTNESIASIEQRVDGAESSISSLTSWQGDAKTSIANVEQKSNANESKINSLTSWQGEASESIANVEQKATDNESAIEGLTTWKGEATESIASVKQTADQNSADISLIATWKSDVEDDVSSIASIKTTSDENKAAISELVEKDGELSKTIAGVKTTADDNQASIEELVSWQSKVDPTINSVAGIKQTADGNTAKIEGLTTWQGTTNIAMARIEQKADANGAYIKSTVSNMDKYSVGPHSQAYGFTLEQAGSVLEEGVIYVPTESVTEEYNYTGSDGKTQTCKRTFTPQYLYKWGKVSGQYRWITVDKNYTETSETNTSSKAVYFATTEPTVSGNFGYWYTNGSTITGTTGAYEPYTLYKWESYVDENKVTQHHWVAVATLVGNSSNRAVSQIRQDANSIELRVTNAEGSAASSKQWIDDNSANIQDVVSWKSQNGESLVSFMQTADEKYASASQVAKIVDEDGNVIESSIVTAVNNNASSIYLSADNITFEGFASFKEKVEDVEDKSIYDTKVEYALSSSFTEFTAVTGNDGKWSTTAPVWRADAYMWQKTTITKGDASIASTQTCIHGARGQDGTIDPNAKQVNTHTRTQPLTWWQEHADSACTDRNWTINAGQGYSNTHLTVGDLAYIVGVATGNDSTNMTVIICGVVEEVVEPSGSTSGKVTMTPSHLIVGGQKGEQGGKGNDAPKVVSEEKQFHTSTSNTTAPNTNSSSWATVPMNYEKGKYLWTRSVYTMDDNSVIKGDAYLDKNFTTISNWCKDNNEAYIDGANIYAGSVTADQIDTSTLIVGENIQMGENAKISWDNVDGTGDVASKTDVSTAKTEAITAASNDATSKANAAQTNAINTASADATAKANDAKSGAISEIDGRGYQNASQVTQITKDTISTTNVIAENLQVNAVNIKGQLTIGQLNDETVNKIDNSIASAVIEYAQSDGSDPEDEPTSGWDTTAPEWQEGMYMWQRTTITYTDHTAENPHQTVTTTCIQGARGETGPSGSGFKLFTTSYSFTQENMELWAVKDAIWTVSESTSGVKIGDTVMLRCYNTTKGGYSYVLATVSLVQEDKKIRVQGIGLLDKGDTGIGVSKVTPQYCLSTDNVNAPDEDDYWNDDFDTVLANYNTARRESPDEQYYIWNREVVTYSSGAVEYSTPTVNSASSFIASWCDINDTTKINGGNIATGTVTAKQINTVGLRAEYIQSSDYSPGINVESLIFDNVGTIGYRARLKQDAISETVIIPSSYNGLPVIGIEGNSFEAGKDIIKTLAIPSTITTVPFGFLEGYSVLEEIHMPIVYNTNEYSDTWFAALFGDTDSDQDVQSIPATLKRVFIFSSTQIPSYYFYFGGYSLSIYLANTVTLVSDRSILVYENVYYCGNKENLVVDSYAGIDWEDIQEADEYISLSEYDASATGFRISSKDNEPMIDSKYFTVTQDGVLSARGANIEGEIKSIIGSIGGLEISEGGLEVRDGNQKKQLSIDKTGLLLGDVSLQYDEDTRSTIMHTVGNFIISSDGGSKIEFVRNDESSSVSSNVRLHITQFNIDSTDVAYLKLKLSSESAPMYDVNCTVFWRTIIEMGGSELVQANGSIKMLIGAEKYESEEYDLSIMYSNGVAPGYTKGIQFHNYYDYDYYWSDIFNSTVTENGPIVHYFYQEQSPNDIIISGNLVPKTSADKDGTSGGGYNIGAGDNGFWNTIFVRKTEVGSSDRNNKNSIQPLSDVYEQIFDALKPVSYKFNQSNNNRTHTGLVAQDVKEAVENAGLTTQDFAAYCEWENDDGSIGCGLRYGEFISLCIDQIQKLKKRVEELEEKLDNTK